MAANEGAAAAAAEPAAAFPPAAIVDAFRAGHADRERRLDAIGCECVTKFDMKGELQEFHEILFVQYC